MKIEKEGLSTIVNKILNNEILLPDFQRKFVWKEEEQQKKLVASVLAKMPIGSILLLEANAEDYAYKELGSKEKCNKAVSGKKYFLLDGQQRITVLTNVFSSVLFQINRPSELVAGQALKKRFCIKTPDYDELENKNDIFGLKYLQFPYADPEQEPTFLTEDILEMLEVKGFNANDKKNSFNPYNGIGDDGIDANLIKTCNTENEFLIPLFLLTEKINTTKNEQYLKRILKQLTSFIEAKIEDEFEQRISDEEKREFVKKVLQDEFFTMLSDDEVTDISSFREQLSAQAENWRDKFVQYLKSCIDKISLNQIVVEESQRDRAIDIYENLNRGGISLSVFDLIMARVAKVYKDDFYKRLVTCIQEGQNNAYPLAVLPDTTVGFLRKHIENPKYVSAVTMQCLDKNEDINKEYIEAFLNVLSLKATGESAFAVDCLKREKKLKLDATFIDDNCEIVCRALDRAFYFFHVRCGLRTIKDIHYRLMLVVVAYVFLKDESFVDKKIHDYLEAWYWIVMFSGEFDSDQNRKAIEHLKKLNAIVNNQDDKDSALLWLKNMRSEVLAKKSYSDEELWLYTNIDVTDRAPKEFLRDTVCQFYLAKTYPDLLDENTRMTVFTKPELTLEKHHVMPLGSVKNIKDSTKTIRANKKHYLNTPINFIYLLPETNNKILDMDLTRYQKEISASSMQALHFTKKDLENESDRRDWLKNRFQQLHGEVLNNIDILLS